DWARPERELVLEQALAAADAFANTGAIQFGAAQLLDEVQRLAAPGETALEHPSATAQDCWICADVCIRVFVDRVSITCRCWRRSRSISATAGGVMTTPRQPREESSSTAQIKASAEVSPGKRPITFVRRRTSTKVRSSRLVLRMRLRCWEGKRRWQTSASSSRSIAAIAAG